MELVWILYLVGVLKLVLTEDITFNNNFNSEWSIVSGRTIQPKCTPIPSNMSLCQNLGYTEMRLPNLLEHDNLEEAVSQAGYWNALLGIRCHPDTQIFLCSLYSPVCLDRLVYPCRSLCEGVKRGCEGYMKKYGFPWPEMFRCNRFPNDTGLCITGPPDKSEVDDISCPPCKEPDTYEGILHNYCKADFVIRATVKGLNQRSGNGEPGDVEIIMGKRKKKFFKKNNDQPKKVQRMLADRRARIFIQQGIGCSCDARIIPRKHHLMAIKVRQVYNRTGQKITSFYATLITPWKDNNNKLKVTIKKALRATRKNKDLCQGGLLTLNTHKQINEQVSKKKKSKRDKKQRRRRKQQ